MKKSYLQITSLGLALFSMFFGAGNIIFPLTLGCFAGQNHIWATLGFLLTGAVMPVMGVLAMVLYQGQHRDFFGRMGRLPGFLVALLLISLIGPFGSTPRCIALSHTTLLSLGMEIPLWVFSLFCSLLLYVCSVKRGAILTLLGSVLTPLLVLSLGLIMVLGFLAPEHAEEIMRPAGVNFWHGLKEGYNTMDLLAAFFFSSTFVSLLKMKKEKVGVQDSFAAIGLGMLLLAVVYMGFTHLAARHGALLKGTSPDALLATLTLKIGGIQAGYLVLATVALACLTTAIALLTAFSDFVHKEVFKEKISYANTLWIAIGITFIVSTFRFEGISAFLGPILQVLYPALIVLTFVNMALAKKLKQSSF